MTIDLCSSVDRPALLIVAVGNGVVQPIFHGNRESLVAQDCHGVVTQALRWPSACRPSHIHGRKPKRHDGKKNNAHVPGAWISQRVGMSLRCVSSRRPRHRALACCAQDCTVLVGSCLCRTVMPTVTVRPASRDEAEGSQSEHLVRRHRTSRPVPAAGAARLLVGNAHRCQRMIRRCFQSRRMLSNRRGGWSHFS